MAKVRGTPAREGGGSVRSTRDKSTMSLSDATVWHAARSLFRLQLLEAVRARPGVDARALAEAIGSSAPRLFYHLKILVKSGLIEAEPANNRRSARGPVAMVYRACCPDFTAGFFARDTRAAERSRKLDRMLADEALSTVFAKSDDGRRSWTLFRWEALRDDEIAAIRGHAEAIERILQAAQGRRRREGSIPRANMQVSLLMAPLGRPTLPDGARPTHH